MEEITRAVEEMLTEAWLTRKWDRFHALSEVLESIVMIEESKALLAERASR